MKKPYKNQQGAISMSWIRLWHTVVVSSNRYRREKSPLSIWYELFYELWIQFFQQGKGLEKKIITILKVYTNQKFPVHFCDEQSALLG